MSYSGKTIKTWLDSQGIYHLEFNNTLQSSNVFNKQTLAELKQAYENLSQTTNVKALLMQSGKDHFVLGADITEFMDYFSYPPEKLTSWLTETNQLFSQFEDLPYPTACAINGFAFGGGFEICLTTDFRLMTAKAKVGLLETKLGIIPGWGGTVRLSRLTSADNAIEWVTSGKQYSAKQAFQVGAVDGVIENDQLISSAEQLLLRAVESSVDWTERRQRKTSALTLNQTEATMAFQTSKAYVAGLAGKNYPAPVKAVDVIAQGANLKRDDALKIETQAFVECAQTKTAESLVRVFLGDQFLKKKSKNYSQKSERINRAAVLGAGIMGGGISYQSASRGIAVTMKDISDSALELGMNEAISLLSKQVARGKINQEQMAKVIAQIHPTLNYGDFKDVNFVVEAVVENEKIKKQVLKEVEEQTSEKSFLASNTSTISITQLAKDLKRPERFCGMHFFNPVHRMPLVEIIRGEKTSEETIAAGVSYALSMGKTPIVVNDCAGFLVNRVLFPYFFGFVSLIDDGVDFRRIDKVMEKFGWPMGPAYLLDVVGIDTGFHAAEIMANAFSDRMQMADHSILHAMYQQKRFGQKNKVGFYSYEKDRKGKLKKVYKEEVESLIQKVVKNKVEVSDEQIVERMMFPMIFECIRCLEDKIVESAIEVDMGLLLGLGFPPFRAGALKYSDDIGLPQLLERSLQYEKLGNMYRAPQMLKDMVQNNQKFY